ncbi:hypothetical protein SMD44_08281 [Streptomyces alboflavus]|uniref:Uncharacterized protein n=1 Tax=Streptomyces alboflavus TaxID=67267 RepID=A0A1Z1WQW2_9ACTN|nr:hypothetical protein SMD44_08281 [Streptomyces alboflavus]
MVHALVDILRAPRNAATGVRLRRVGEARWG